MPEAGNGAAGRSISTTASQPARIQPAGVSARAGAGRASSKRRVVLAWGPSPVPSSNQTSTV
jgi:hypothetical protein